MSSQNFGIQGKPNWSVHALNAQDMRLIAYFIWTNFGSKHK